MRRSTILAAAALPVVVLLVAHRVPRPAAADDRGPATRRPGPCSTPPTGGCSVPCRSGAVPTRRPPTRPSTSPTRGRRPCLPRRRHGPRRRTTHGRTRLRAAAYAAPGSPPGRSAWWCSTRRRPGRSARPRHRPRPRRGDGGRPPPRLPGRGRHGDRTAGRRRHRRARDRRTWCSPGNRTAAGWSPPTLPISARGTTDAPGADDMTIDIDRLEQIVKRAVATGAAVVVVVLAPGTSTGTGAGTGTGDRRRRTGRARRPPPPPPATGRTTATASAVASRAADTGGRDRRRDARLGYARPGSTSSTPALGRTGTSTTAPGTPATAGARPRRSRCGTASSPSPATPSGTTAGMSWGHGQKYGRWEARVRAPAADPSYHALLLLWPDAENLPGGGEIDFMEMLRPRPAEGRPLPALRRGRRAGARRGRGRRHASGTTGRWSGRRTSHHRLPRRPRSGSAPPTPRCSAARPDAPVHPARLVPRATAEDGRCSESTMQVDWVREYAVDAAIRRRPTDPVLSAPGSADCGLLVVTGLSDLHERAAVPDRSPPRCAVPPPGRAPSSWPARSRDRRSGLRRWSSPCAVVTGRLGQPADSHVRAAGRQQPQSKPGADAGPVAAVRHRGRRAVRLDAERARRVRRRRARREHLVALQGPTTDDVGQHDPDNLSGLRRHPEAHQPRRHLGRDGVGRPGRSTAAGRSGPGPSRAPATARSCCSGRTPRTGRRTARSTSWRPRTGDRDEGALRRALRARTTTRTARPSTGDFTQWHIFAVEWAPDHIVGFLDGVRRSSATRTRTTIPAGPDALRDPAGHRAVRRRLDPGRRTRPRRTRCSFEVDWVRIYAP